MIKGSTECNHDLWRKKHSCSMTPNLGTSFENCQGEDSPHGQKNEYLSKVRFDTYDLKLELSKTNRGHWAETQGTRDVDRRDPKPGCLKMRQEGEDPIPLQAELISDMPPSHCVVSVSSASPLGIQPRRSGRSNGFVFSIMILLGY